MDREPRKRVFNVQLSHGQNNETVASAAGEVLVSSKMPLRDSARKLLDAAADQKDWLYATRDGRDVARHPLAFAASWKDQAPPALPPRYVRQPDAGRFSGIRKVSGQ